jgi:hypothetical protein
MSTRTITKFENIAASISYTFPLHLYEAQEEQQLRTSFSVGVGANYAHDHLGYAAAPKSPGIISIRALAKESSQANLEAEIDEARGECYRIGLGYLYRVDADGSTTRRCLARVSAMPGMTINVNSQFGISPMVFQFEKLSDWMADTATTGSQTIDAGNESVTVNNPGNLPVYASIWRLRNNGTTRAEHPVLFNSTTGQYAAFNRAMNIADHELYLATGTRLVQFSDNNGSSYANDYANFAGDFLRLDPGNNTIKVCCGRPHVLPWLNTIRIPAFSLEWSFYPNYV